MFPLPRSMQSLKAAPFMCLGSIGVFDSMTGADIGSSPFFLFPSLSVYSFSGQ